MPVSQFYKIDSLAEALCEKAHNLGSDVLKVALTNTAPNAGLTQLSQITEISYTYCSDRTVTQTTSSQTNGVYKLVVNDLVLTASGGSFGPFRYVVLYNDTSTNDLLIGYYDYGSSITVQDGETFTIDFSQTNGLLTLTIIQP